MAKWIWLNEEKIDQYVEFISNFNSSSKKVSLKICADTDYMVYINKKLVAFGQHYFYEKHPIYDLVDVKCKIGYNDIKIVVYHDGSDSCSAYSKGKAGLYFQLLEDKKVILESNEDILSAESKLYESGHKRPITNQLGYGVFVDNKYVNTKLNYSKSKVVDKPTDFRIRENKKLVLKGRKDYEIKHVEKGHYLIDFKEEITGYLDLDFVSFNRQLVKICWGEHIVDGKVRETIDGRNFITEFKAKKGKNKFFSTLRRYGLRYMEVYCKEDININYFGIQVCEYPFKEKKVKIDNLLRQRIYDVAKHTLVCCYHEHFEDCPWREQSFYSYDSRNQMLCHEVAFKNKEAIKSAIKLEMECERKDGLLDITYPAGIDLTIPSFSFYVFEQLLIYYRISKDTELLEESYPRLMKIIDSFIQQYDGKLLRNRVGKPYWNFYEWVEGLDDAPWFTSGEIDVVANFLFIIALKNMTKINKILNKDDDYSQIISSLKRNINKKFLNKEDKLYFFSDTNKKYYDLANSLAIITNVASKDVAENISKNLVNKELIKTSLSTRCFVYDALMQLDKDKYRDFILNEIDTIYGFQLDNGTTTFWETELGESDFDNAGSLCHGWSSMPVYYFKKLGVIK